MNKINESVLQEIMETLKKGQKLEERWKDALFDGKKEYELVYDGKEREEDILADTLAVLCSR